MLRESQSKPEFLRHVATAAVLEEMITALSLSAVTTVVFLHFLRVKNEAGFQRYLKRLTPHAMKKEGKNTASEIPIRLLIVSWNFIHGNKEYVKKLFANCSK